MSFLDHHIHVDNWRVIPRVIIAGYAYSMWNVGNWFMALPDPTGPQAAYVSTMVGAGAAVFGLYTNSGAKK